jgi:hypothetical protein
MIERKRRARTCLKIDDECDAANHAAFSNKQQDKQWNDAAAFARTQSDNANILAASSNWRSVKLPAQGDQS